MLPGDPSFTRFRPPSLLGDKLRIVIAGVLLGSLVVFFLLPERATETAVEVIERAPVVDASVYRPDAEILAEVKDATTIERGTGLKVNVLFHLLAKSYNIGPAAAAALGLSKRSADIDRLRAHPEQYRGQYLWVKGRLEKFDEQKLHPIRRATSYKGRLRTADGDEVVFWVSKPLPESIRDQDRPWVRVAGFFVKIVDEHYVDDQVLAAPLLIGPRVDKAFPDWQPVERLDPKILDPKKNAVFRGGRWLNTEGAGLYLEDSQEEPLWHLAGYAIHEAERNRDTGRRHTEVFELKEQYAGFKTGRYERGAPIRLRGAFIQARVFRADVNPIGIDYWTAAWIRIPRLGAKMVPIWIPRDIGGWKYGETVDVDAFYFKNRAYEAIDSSVVHTPQFVAANLTRFHLGPNPVTLWIGIGFVLFFASLTAVFFRMGRAARAESAVYKEKLIERRRRRRAATVGSFGG